MSNRSEFRTLRLVLGRQLDIQHRWFDKTDPRTLYLVAELGQEVAYVKHHAQKLCAFFAAMGAFADELASRGHAVLHLELDESIRIGDLAEVIRSVVDSRGISRFEFQLPTCTGCANGCVG